MRTLAEDFPCSVSSLNPLEPGRRAVWGFLLGQLCLTVAGSSSCPFLLTYQVKLFNFFLKRFIYLFEGQRERACMGRKRQERVSLKADSTLSTESDVGLDLKTPRSQPELKPRVRCFTN